MRFGKDVERRAIVMPLSLCFAPSPRRWHLARDRDSANAFPVTFFARLVYPVSQRRSGRLTDRRNGTLGGFYNPETMLQAETKDGGQVKLLFLREIGDVRPAWRY